MGSMMSAGISGGYKSSKTNEKVERRFDPYTERARAMAFTLLLNPGLLRSGDGLRSLYRMFLPQGFDPRGVPIGEQGSSNLKPPGVDPAYDPGSETYPFPFAR